MDDAKFTNNLLGLTPAQRTKVLEYVGFKAAQIANKEAALEESLVMYVGQIQVLKAQLALANELYAATSNTLRYKEKQLAEAMKECEYLSRELMDAQRSLDTKIVKLNFKVKTINKRNEKIEILEQKLEEAENKFLQAAELLRGAAPMAPLLMPAPASPKSPGPLKSA